MDERGYAVVERVLPPDTVATVRADLARVLEDVPYGRNDFEGHHTKRIYNLFAKTRAMDEIALHPLLLGVLDRVLGHYQFSAPVGIEIGPGEAAQVIHQDDIVYPLPWPHDTVLVNTMWAFDDFTEANGADPDHPRQPPPRGRRLHDPPRRARADRGRDAGRLGDLLSRARCCTAAAPTAPIDPASA